MNLYLDSRLAKAYKSPSQRIRIMTESWLAKNAYCPNCGHFPFCQATNNTPALDFFCLQCKEQFELKSRSAAKMANKIPDGAYHTMLRRIQDKTAPHFFFLCYEKNNYHINQLILMPSHFFTPELIIPRKPLSPKAKRAGWQGCTIDVGLLPNHGKIALIDQSTIIKPELVQQQWQQTLFLKEQTHKNKNWLLTIMRCIERINQDEFNLKDVYFFEDELSTLFPNNKHIKDKIRQQLQKLRDQNIIEFIAHGKYRKVSPSQ